MFQKITSHIRSHRDFWLSVTVTVTVIVAGLAIGWDNIHTVPVYPYPGFHYLFEPHNPLSFFANWDSADYLTIVAKGYINLFWVNWFPLYPAVVFGVHRIIPSLLDSGFIVSWLGLVGACYFYIKVVRELFGLKDGQDFRGPLQALTFFVLFPTGVFLIAPFSESLYACFALGGIYFALRKKWLPAALLAALCTATHITGPYVVILIALILWEQKVHLGRIIAATLIGGLGLASYMLFLLIRFHRPFGFLESQEIYHHWTEPSYMSLFTSLSASTLLMIVLLGLSVWYWWHRRRSLSIYSLLFFAIPLAGRQYGGFDRYVLMAFPVELMLYGYLRERKTLLPYAMAALGVAWTYFLLQYAGGYIGS